MRSSEITWHVPGLLILLSISCCTVGASPESQPATAPAGDVLRLQVIDAKTRAPLPNVAIEVYRYSMGKNFAETIRTDAHGACSIALPMTGRRRSLGVSATHDGYVGRGFSMFSHSDGTPLPTSLTFALEPGTKIGGIIRNTRGEAVKGASVTINDEQLRSEANMHYQGTPSTTTTDEQGRWQSHSAPSDLSKLAILVTHPDYKHLRTSPMEAQFNRQPPLPLDGLRNGTHVIVLDTGVPLRGRVLDEKGQPIGGASVQAGEFQWNRQDLTQTDGNGTWSLGHYDPGKDFVTAWAPGHTPQMVDIDIKAGLDPIELRLVPGRTLRGRVADPAGQPIAGVYVSTHTWRGQRRYPSHWSGVTDAEGAFVWNDAPEEPVTFSVHGDGYLDNNSVELKPGAENVISLKSALRISGVVTDAVTGKPIENGRVLYRIKFDDRSEMPFQPSFAQPLKDGRYSVAISQPGQNVQLRAESPDHSPALSPRFPMGEGDQTWDAQLKPASGLIGRIVTPQGNPAAGAHVRTRADSDPATLRRDEMPDMEMLDLTTDQRGTFNLLPPARRLRIAIEHDEGYAQITSDDLGKSDPITLQAWGRVEGTLTRGGGAAAAAQVQLSPTEVELRPGREPQAVAITDDNGVFVFERVPEGLAMLDCTDAAGNTLGIGVRVTPGQTARVSMGATGATITGRLVAPPGVPIDFTSQFVGAEIHKPQIEPKLPDGWDQLTLAQKMSWFQSWLASDESRTATTTPSIAFKLQPDGSFRVPDVPPGRYTLSARAMSLKPEDAAKVIGQISQEIEIAQGMEILDVGELSLAPQRVLSIGDRAPDLSVNRLDGTPLNLSDFKGKYVLLDFWATWCGPCIAEMPNLKAVHDRFSTDGRLIVLSVSLDDDIVAPTKLVEAKQLNWTHAHAGQTSAAKIHHDWGVYGIPAIFLIGPEAEILARDLHGEELKAAVEKALDRK